MRQPGPSQDRRRVTGRKMRALCTLFGAFLLSAGLCALPLSIPWLGRHREIIRDFRAGWMGAHYIGDSGVILQSGSNDCGAAALKMILIAHGIECSDTTLFRRLQLTPRGTSMLVLRRVAAELGVPAKSWAIRLRELKRVPLPAIAFINRHHFVVLRRWAAPDVLEVDDPALGRLHLPVRAFQRLWSGETLVFDPAWNPL